MSRQSSRFLILSATATAAFALATTAQAVDLRDWGRKFASVERFVVLSQFNNAAVLDKETQLVWERKPYPTTVAARWKAASACAHLAIGDRRGWRLPYVHEIESLVNPSAPSNTLALPAGHPFQNVPLGYFWTATPTAFDSTGLVVDLGNAGAIWSWNASSSGFRWCVRGAGMDGIL